MRKLHPLQLLALCLFTSPLFAQKDFNAWKSIDCYPGLEYSQKRSTGNGNKESHELSIKFRHHYEKTIAFSYTIKDSGGKNILGSGNASLEVGGEKIIQLNLSDSENLRVVIANFRLGGEDGDLIPCGSGSDDSEKKKDGDEQSDAEEKKEKNKEIEVPVIVPAGGVAATSIVVGSSDKNEGERKQGQEKESEHKKSGDQEQKNETEESEKKTETTEKITEKEKEKETEGKKPEEGTKGKEGEQKEGELKEGERKEGLETGNKGEEKENENKEIKAVELKEGEKKEGEKQEGDEKEHGEQEKEKQVTSPVASTGESENKGAQEIQPVTENKQAEQSNEVTNPPMEEKPTQPVEKAVEKTKSEETPVVVSTPTEQQTQEQEPVKHEEQPKPVEPTPKPEPTVTPIETPVKETKTEESAPVTETKAKEVPEPVEEEKQVKEEETSEGETIKETEEEKSLPEEGAEAGEAKEGEGETEKEEEEANDDLKRRIEEGNQRQQEADASQNQMVSQLGDILSADGGGDVYTRLAIGMNLEGGFAVQAVPMVENASSSTGGITPYSASTLPINLGIYARPELWLLRNEYFGLGIDYRVIITYSVLAGGGISSTALASGGNLRFQAGLKHFKLHFQGGKENRNGTYSNDHDVTNNALGSGTNNNIYSDGDYNYQVTNTGFGALIDFRDYNNKEAFIKYTLSYERPDFLPTANAAIKTHTIHVRYFLDIIFTYGNKYPIAGKPSYTYLTSDKNKDYFFFGLGKTFKIFKSK